MCVVEFMFFGDIMVLMIVFVEFVLGSVNGLVLLLEVLDWLME